MHSKELPRLLVITDRKLMRPTFGEALESALLGGARLVQLREKGLALDELRALAQTAAHLCEKYGAQLLINANADLALEVRATGVHLPGGLSLTEARNVLGADMLCGISVHSIEEAQRAADEGADYLIFGSVFETASHPGAEAAGLEKLRQVVQATPLPVFAVGGIDAQRAVLCRNAGAHGVAVISAIWNAADTEAAAHGLTKTLK